MSGNGHGESQVMSDMRRVHLKPLYERPRDWWKDLVDSEKTFTGGLKNPLVWILSIIITAIIIYLRDFS